MPPLISVHNLNKTFRVNRRRSGMWGTLHSLVKPQYQTITAVNGVQL